MAKARATAAASTLRSQALKARPSTRTILRSLQASAAEGVAAAKAADRVAEDRKVLRTKVAALRIQVDERPGLH